MGCLDMMQHFGDILNLSLHPLDWAQQIVEDLPCNEITPTTNHLKDMSTNFATATTSITSAVANSFFEGMQYDDLNTIMLTSTLLGTLHDEADCKTRTIVIIIIAKSMVRIGVELGDVIAARAAGVLDGVFSPRVFEQIEEAVFDLQA